MMESRKTKCNKEGTPIMPFEVCMQPLPVVWDTLPVAKLTKYPFAKGAYRPFSQARICCVTGQGLFVRMWSFEVEYRCEETEPRVLLEDSCMTVCLSAEGEEYLRITSNARGVLFIEKCRGETVVEEYEPDCLHALHAFTGEDLQGEYWGVEFFIPYELLHTKLGFPALEAGFVFQGNFYCTRLDGIKEHFGCLFPVHSERPAFLPESFGTFEIVDY